MATKIDKRDRAAVFRDRLNAAITQQATNRSALARAVGVDRSTIGQLLGSTDARLPNGQLVGDLALVLKVSSDWLLGLTDRPERPGDILNSAMAVTGAARSSADDQIMDWHREAEGYKIRHVPATLPDMLKTEQVLHWEYRDHLGRSADQAIAAMQERMDHLNNSSSDFEIAFPIHELSSFASGSGYYESLDAGIRREQLAFLADRCRSHYPRLRLSLFDARHIFSAPVTIFGPLLAVIYVGRFYLAFREGRRLQNLTEHFDQLVREATIDGRDVPVYIETLADKIG